MTTDSIRERINKTKPREEWQEEIVFLYKHWESEYFDLFEQIPDEDNFDGFNEIDFSEDLIFTENGKDLKCSGMIRDKDNKYFVRIGNDENAIQIPLKQLRNMASYQSIVKRLLEIITYVENFPLFDDAE